VLSSECGHSIHRISTSIASPQFCAAQLAPSSSGGTKLLEDTLKGCLEQLLKNECPPEAALCQLFIGSGFAEYEAALDLVNKTLRPKALLGCVVHAVKDHRGMKSPLGVAMAVKMLPVGAKVVPFSYLPRSFHQIQVGRHNVPSSDPDKFDMEFDYKNFVSVSTSPARIPLPDSLAALQTRLAFAVCFWTFCGTCR